MAGGLVLLDTNVIIEAHRTSSWRTLAARYTLETVETCFTESQTGAQSRRPEQRIDPVTLRGALAEVHDVSDVERARALLRDASMSNLDAGERDLWAHALERQDAWILTGPDAASLRIGVKLGFRERLVALEALLADVGHRTSVPLRRNYTRKWHTEMIAKLVAEEGWGT